MGKINQKNYLGKILFGSIFIIFLPLLLIIWSYFTKNLIKITVPFNTIGSNIIIFIGGMLVILGMFSLWYWGKGLPMNAYPPKHFVQKSVYAFCRNPIYLGTILLSFGISALLKSSSGFWLISPFLLLMIVTYTMGFENEKTQALFGKQTYYPFLSLSENSNNRAYIKDKLSTIIITYLIWLCVYEIFIFVGNPKDAIISNWIIDNYIPYIELSIFPYMLVYIYAFLTPFILKTKKQLRHFTIDVLLSTALAGYIYFCVPFIVVQKNISNDTLLNKILLLDRSFDGTNASFPSFHVIWAFLSAYYFSFPFKKIKWFWYALAILISISCLTTGSHSTLDVLGGLIIVLLVLKKSIIWNFFKIISEKIANSWKEWQVGSIRIINHGIYAGLAAFVGSLIIDSFFNVKDLVPIIIIKIFAILGAAIWAQWIESSSKLQRPFGYYGSVMGVFIGSGIVFYFFNIKFSILIGSFSMAAPWIQLIGRLRCLVQGCCHGKISNKEVGIVFTHPLSRVNTISGLINQPLYPTQIYSMGANFLIGIILCRLYQLKMPASFISGIYLLLTSLSRFVEEHFRGEAQTPYYLGMRYYQWIAIVTMFMGAILTCVPSQILPEFKVNLTIFYTAIVMTIISFIAYGVDFPYSQKRFAKLTIR